MKMTKLMLAMLVGTAMCFGCSERASEAQITVTRGRVSTIEDACNIYSMRHNGRFPDSINELVSSTDAGAGLLKDEDLTDSWNMPFQYQRHGRKIVITSGGPDLKMGTDDDITN